MFLDYLEKKRKYSFGQTLARKHSQANCLIWKSSVTQLMNLKTCQRTFRLLFLIRKKLLENGE